MGLGDISPVGEAQAHVCVSNIPALSQFVCCPFSAHHAAAPWRTVENCVI